MKGKMDIFTILILFSMLGSTFAFGEEEHTWPPYDGSRFTSWKEIPTGNFSGFYRRIPPEHHLRFQKARKPHPRYGYFDTISAIVTLPNDIRPPPRAIIKGKGGQWAGSAFVAMDAIHRTEIKKWYRRRYAGMPQVGLTWIVTWGGRDAKTNKSEPWSVSFVFFGSCYQHLEYFPWVFKDKQSVDPGSESRPGDQIYIELATLRPMPWRPWNIGEAAYYRLTKATVRNLRTNLGGQHEQTCGWPRHFTRKEAGWFIDHQDLAIEADWKAANGLTQGAPWRWAQAVPVFPEMADYGTLVFSNLTTTGTYVYHDKEWHIKDPTLHGNKTDYQIPDSTIHDKDWHIDDPTLHDNMKDYQITDGTMHDNCSSVPHMDYEKNQLTMKFVCPKKIYDEARAIYP